MIPGKCQGRRPSVRPTTGFCAPPETDVQLQRLTRQPSGRRPAAHTAAARQPSDGLTANNAAPVPGQQPDDGRPLHVTRLTAECPLHSQSKNEPRRAAHRRRQIGRADIAALSISRELRL